MTQLRLSPAPLPSDTTAEKGSTAQVTHYLTLPDYLDPADLEFLFQCQEPRAVWETLPQELVDSDVVEIVPGTIRLSPHAVLHGPYSPLILAPEADGEVIAVETAAVSMGDTGVILDTGVLQLDQNALFAAPETLAHPAGFPTNTVLVWALTVSSARGEAAFREGGDRDGLARVFAEGLPIRDEWRQAVALVAVARFLEGTVHFDALRTESPVSEERFRSVAPDRAANVDLTVYSDVWLDPQAASRLAQLVAPTMEYMPTEVEWAGPAEVPEGTEFERVVTQAQEILSPEWVERLRVQAEEFDQEALSESVPPTAYGLAYDAPKGDLITVEVSGTDELPPILESVEWAQGGVIEYRFSWVPADLDDWQKEIPSFELRQRRTRMASIVKDLARSLYSATAGEIVDQDGFLIDPSSL